MKYVLYVFLLLLLPSLGMAQDYGSGSPMVSVSPSAGGAPLDVGSILMDAADERASGDCGATTCIGDVIGNASADRWTIEYWTNCDSGLVINRTALAGLDASTFEWRFRHSVGTGSEVQFYNNGAGGADYRDAQEDNMCDDTWHHIALTFDGSSATDRTTNLYIDGGTPVTPTFGWGGSADDMAATDTWMIGNDDATYHFGGRIADLRVWDVVRSSTEINDNKDCQIACADDTTACPTNLYAYWPINEGTGTTINEMAGTAGSVDLTVSGATLDSTGPTFTNDGSAECYDDGS